MSSTMFEVGVARALPAQHQLAEDVASAPKQHQHEYRVEVVVRGEALGESGMLLDLDVLAATLSECLRPLESADLDSLPLFAGRNTTVEVLAQHIWDFVARRVAGAAPLQSVRVTVRESADAWASVDQAL